MHLPPIAPPSRPPRAIRIAALALALALAACGAGTGPLRAQSPPARIPAAELLEDFAVLRDAYETLHPGLYRYADSARVAAGFGALREELSRDRTLAEAYLAISVFLASVRCGHSYANFFNQPEAVADALLERDRVPFLSCACPPGPCTTPAGTGRRTWTACSPGSRSGARGRW